MYYPSIMSVTDGRPRMGGPIPKFNDYHIWKSLYCLTIDAPVGRKKLASLIGIGEGSTRTVLNILQENGLITVKKNGITLTPEGKATWNSVLMNVSPLVVTAITIGGANCAVQIPHSSNRVKYGCEERDTAIKAGALGATTLIVSNGMLLFPGNDYPLDPRADRAIRAAFLLNNDDTIIIGTADTQAAAEEGAVTAGLNLLGGLRLRKDDGEMFNQRSTGDELIALAFMVHDLVGGLPVCAKRRDNLGIRIENGKVIDNAYTGAVLEEVLGIGTTVRRVATSGPYKGIRVIVTPLEMDNRVIAAIGVVDVRTMAGVNNLIRLHSGDELNIHGNPTNRQT